jgi:prophage regulatory protein
MQIDRFLRLDQVIDLTALSRSEIYRRIQAGTFPRQTRISHKKAIWKESEIANWQQQVAGV